jgi:hypothetical protein
MTLRVKLALGIVLVLFAACHVAAAYKMEASAASQPTESLALNRD